MTLGTSAVVTFRPTALRQLPGQSGGGTAFHGLARRHVTGEALLEAFCTMLKNANGAPLSSTFT